LLKYFLGIEVAQSTSGIIISQWTYALDIEIRMLQCRPSDTPMDPHLKLLSCKGNLWKIRKYNVEAQTQLPHALGPYHMSTKCSKSSPQCPL